MKSRAVFEGTWEELTRRAETFAGRRIRLVVLPSEVLHSGSEPLPSYHEVSPEDRATAYADWARSFHGTPILSDEAISRHGLYREVLDRHL